MSHAHGSRGPSSSAKDQEAKPELVPGEQDPVHDPMRRVRQEREAATTQIGRSLKAWRAVKHNAPAKVEDGEDQGEQKDGAKKNDKGAGAAKDGGGQAKPEDAGDQAKPQGAGIQVAVDMPVIAGPPISFDAPDYAGLYAQVKARADSGKEAGSVTRDFDQACDADPPTSCTFKIPLTMCLPSWSGYAAAPAEHKQKYDTWYASVKAHEDQHVQIYKTEYAKLKATVVGPSQDEAYAQGSAVDNGAGAAQQAFDDANQPAPLAIPGGTEKIPPDGGGGDGGN